MSPALGRKDMELLSDITKGLTCFVCFFFNNEQEDSSSQKLKFRNGQQMKGNPFQQRNQVSSRCCYALIVFSAGQLFCSVLRGIEEFTKFIDKFIDTFLARFLFNHNKGKLTLTWRDHVS